MMIAIMTIELGSHVILNALPNDIRKNIRRLAKTATLDGGSVIVDGGVSNSDRDLAFDVENVSPEIRDALWKVFGNESLICLSCPEGVFSGYLESVTIKNAGVGLSFSVHEKLT